MIDFKGVTSSQQAEPQRLSIQETVPQVEALQLKKQLTKDTVSFSSSPYQQTKIVISCALKFPEIKTDPMAKKALQDLKLLAAQDKKNNIYQSDIQEHLKSLLEEYKLRK